MSSQQSFGNFTKTVLKEKYYKVWFNFQNQSLTETEPKKKNQSRQLINKLKQKNNDNYLN